MSTGFNAGRDSSDVVLRYGVETVWNEAPAVAAMQEIRFTGESLSEQKTRTRPEEVKADGFVSHALTTQVQASGGINFALSFGTYDDLLAGLLNGAFSTLVAVQSVATTGNITVRNGGVTPLAIGGGGFEIEDDQLDPDEIVAGQWIRVSGFTGPTNNGLFLVTDVDDVSIPNEIQVSETAGTGGAGLVEGATGLSTAAEVNIQGSVLRNGIQNDTFLIEKQFSSALFLLYAGSYISDGNLSAQVGGFVEGTFNFLCASEVNDTTTKGSPSTAAPTGRVIDTVVGISNLELDGAAVAGVIQGINWTVTKNNARAQYGIGDSDAQGMARGTIDVSGSMSVYFNDFTLYLLYKAETDHIVSFAALDDTGAGYIFTLPGATLMNPTIVAGGPDTDVVAEFQLEGNEGSGDYVGVIFQIDKIPAAI